VSAIALVLSLAGIYAITSFTVSRRTREIAVRVALGAQISNIVGTVFRGPFFQVAGGVAVGCDNVLYLHGDVGVGAGIIADGRRVAGHAGYGGEVGHMVVNPYGRECGCGSRGCWETEIGEYALLRKAGRTGETGREAVLEAIRDHGLASGRLIGTYERPDTSISVADEEGVPAILPPLAT